MPHPGEDDLTLLALGESLPPVATHVRACSSCRQELAALGAAVRTAREADLSTLPPPPPAVWDRVVAELALDGPPARRWRRGPALVAAGLAAALVGGALVTGGLVGGELGVTTSGDPAGREVPLTALGGSAGTGELELSTASAGRVLRIDTEGLPRADGFYEVWLLDPGTDRLVALGALDEGGHARLSVPEGVDLADYAVVDVSAEPDDGDPQHSGASVLRADLPA